MPIERTKPAESTVRDSIAHLNRQLSGEFQRKLEASKRRAELSEAALAPLRSLIESDTRSAEALGHLERVAKEERRQQREVTGQIYFQMEAGVTYLAWVWCWANAAIMNGSSLSGGGLQCNTPFIVVED